MRFKVPYCLSHINYTSIFTDSGGGSSSLRGAGVGGEVLWNPSLNCSYLAPNYDGNASYLLPRSSNNLVSLKRQGIFSSAKRLAVPKLHPTTTPCLWISSGLHCSKLKINFVSPHSTKLRKYCTFEKYAGLAKLQVCYIASLRPEDMQRYRRRVSLPRKAPAGGRDLFNLMSEEVSALASDDYFFLQLFHEYDSRSFSRFFVGSPKAPLQDAHEVLWSIIISHNAPRPSVPKNI